MKKFGNFLLLFVIGLVVLTFYLNSSGMIDNDNKELRDSLENKKVSIPFEDNPAILTIINISDRLSLNEPKELSIIFKPNNFSGKINYELLAQNVSYSASFIYEPVTEKEIEIINTNPLEIELNEEKNIKATIIIKKFGNYAITVTGYSEDNIVTYEEMYIRIDSDDIIVSDGPIADPLGKYLIPYTSEFNQTSGTNPPESLFNINSFPSLPVEIVLIADEGDLQLNKEIKVTAQITANFDVNSGFSFDLVPSENIEIVNFNSNSKEFFEDGETIYKEFNLIPRKSGRNEIELIVKNGDEVLGGSQLFFLILDDIRVIKDHPIPIPEEITENAQELLPFQIPNLDLMEEPEIIPEVLEFKIPLPDEEQNLSGSNSSNQILEFGNTVNVEGTFYYNDRQANSQYARWVEVRVWDYDIFSADDLLAVVLTDVNGYFNTGPINNVDPEGGSQDIYTQVRTISGAGQIQGSTNGDTVYDGFTPTNNNVANGVFNIGGWTAQPSGAYEDEAWWLYQDIMDGWNYVANTLNPSFTMPQQIVNYNSINTIIQSTYYSQTSGEIFLYRLHGYRPHPLLHEYGHSVMDKIYNSYPPTPNCNPHSIGIASSTGCAWSEGWASFFALAVLNTNIFQVPTAYSGTGTTSDYNFETRTSSSANPSPWNSGEQVEGNIGASLWDFYDSSNDGYDIYNGGIQSIWPIFESQDDNTFNQYWNAWNQNNPSNQGNGLGAIYQNTINYFQTGNQCSVNLQCPSGYCEGSQNNPARCCSSQPLSSGWYGGGNTQTATCGVTDNDASSQNRDYYCSSTGGQNYEVLGTFDCDNQDGWYGGGNTVGCGPDPSSTWKDYYVQSNTNSCAFTNTCSGTGTFSCDNLDNCAVGDDYHVNTNTNTCVLINYPPPNQPPTITSTPVTSAQVSVLYNYQVTATDPENDTLTYFLTQSPIWMVINNNNGLITWAPTSIQVGNHSVTVSVFDSFNPGVTQSYIINVQLSLNQPPTITSTPVTTAQIGVQYIYQVTATDPENDPLIYALTQSPTGMNINSVTGLIQWTPTTPQVGNNSVTVSVSDPTNPSVTQSFSINVQGTFPPINISGWTQDIRLTNDPLVSRKPSIAMDSLENSHVIWEDNRDGNLEIYYKKLDNNGNTLVNDLRLTNNPARSETSSVAVDSQDNIHIVWFDHRDDPNPSCWPFCNFEIYYKKLDNNGNTLVNDTRLTFDSSSSIWPSLVLDNQNSVHIIWRDERDGNQEIYYKKLDNNGNLLVNDTRITNDPSFSLAPNNFDVDLIGNVHLAWADNRDGNYEIYYKKLDNNGNMLVSDTRLTYNPSISDFPFIVIDNQNNVQITWYDYRDGNSEIYYKKLDNNGNTLVNDLRLTNSLGASEIPSIALDSGNNIHVVWWDDRDGNSEIYYKKLDNNGNTLVNDTRLTSNSTDSVWPSLVLDNQDSIHVVWEDYRDGNAEIYYKRTLPPPIICTVPTNGMIINQNTTLCPGNYTLPNGINIGADNMVLDGNEASIIGNGASGSGANGVTILGKNNVTIKNLNISKYYIGINLSTSNNNNILHNNISLNFHGIFLESSLYNIIDSNSFESNTYSGIGTYLFSPSNYNNITNNVFKSNSNSLFFEGQNTNFYISGNVIQDTASYGVWLQNSVGSLVINNTIYSNSSNSKAIYAFSTHQSVFDSNNITSNALGGIYIISTTGSTFKNNIIMDNGPYGIRLNGGSFNNNILNNFIYSNVVGVDFSNTINYAPSGNYIINNTITLNEKGININGSYNLIYNNFFNNTNNAFDYNLTNFWNSTKTPGVNIIGGPLIGGNFWHDYAGVDLNGDGLGDTNLPYNSNGQIVNGGDFLPLTTNINITQSILSWTQDIRLTNDSAISERPSLAIDSQGNSHIVWEDSRDGHWEIYYTKLDNNGNVLVNDKRLTFNNSNSNIPSIAIDSQDDVHIVWHSNRDDPILACYPNCNFEIYYKKLDNNGNTLVNDTRLTFDSSSSIWPSLVLDNQNSVHVIWRDERDGNREIYYKKLDNNGNTLINDIRLTNDPSLSYAPNNFGIDLLGNLYIVWTDFRDGNAEIYFKKLDNNGNILVNDLRLTNDVDNSDFPSIIVDHQNNIQIVWYDYRDGNWEIYYEKLDNNGNTLVNDRRLTYSLGTSAIPTVDVDSQNDLHVGWYDNRNGNNEIYYKKLDDNGNTLVNDTRLTNDSAISSWPSLVLDDQNLIHMIWEDYRDGNQEIYYKRSITSPHLIVEGTTKIGNTINIQIADPNNANMPYIVGLSYGNMPGFQIPNMPLIPLNYDFLLQNVLSYPNNWGTNLQGVLDSNGHATASIPIPNIPSIIGNSVYVAFVTTNNAGNNILSVSPPVQVVIQ